MVYTPNQRWRHQTGTAPPQLPHFYYLQGVAMTPPQGITHQRYTALRLKNAHRKADDTKRRVEEGEEEG